MNGKIVFGILLVLAIAGATNFDAALGEKEITFYSNGYFFTSGSAAISGSGDYLLRIANFTRQLDRPLSIIDENGAVVGWKLYYDEIKKKIEKQKDIWALLNDSMGKTIIVKIGNETFSGTLVWYDQSRIAIVAAGGWKFVNLVSADSFITPSLNATEKVEIEEYQTGLEISGSGNGNRKVDVGYLSSGQSWKQGYLLRLNGESDSGSADLESWAEISNPDYDDWQDVKVNLIIGNPNFASVVVPYNYNGYAYEKNKAFGAVAESAPAAPAISAIAATGYWRYEIEPVSLKKGESGAYEIVKRSVPYKRKFVWTPSYGYDWTNTRKYITFNNTGPELLGSGVVQVFDKTVLLGEDNIGFTSKGTEAELYVSDNAEMRAKKEMIKTETTQVGSNSITTADYKIVVENNMGEPATVTIREYLPTADKVEITSDISYEKKPNNVVEWTLKMGGGSRVEIPYTIKTTTAYRYY